MQIDVFVLIAFILFLLIAGFLFYKLNLTIDQKLSRIDLSYSQHLTSSQNTLVNLAEKLTELKLAAQNIHDIGENIQSLQDILKPPKLRGAFGESFLERVLEQVLPSQCYKLQYKFSSGNIVDAVVKLKDSQLLSIDSKFPLSSFRFHAGNISKDNEIVSSQFIRDVKKHIDSISAKYILPNEGTLDFALMYIPAENVYYEIVLKEEEITEYAKSKKVIPISPLSLYSYLSVILVGLKGMEIEKNAKQILSQIGSLKICFENYLEEFNTLGGHINNAKSKYDSSKKLIDDICNNLNTIEVDKKEQAIIKTL